MTLSSRVQHHGVPPEQASAETSASDASLTTCQYTQPPETAATPSAAGDGGLTPSPGNPGEGRSEGSSIGNPQTPTLTLPRNTGGGDQRENRERKTTKRRGPWLQLFSSKGFEWNHLDLQVRYLHPALRGFRILHLSDVHLKPRWSGAYDELISRLDQNPPDLIAITGDFVDRKLDHRATLPVLERFLSQLRSRVGIFAITGNHDSDLLGPRLGSLGVRYISGKYLRLSVADTAIELIGIPGVKRRDFDPEFIQSIPARITGVPRIVLGHYPDQIPFIEPLQADALLVGHTHGGQICLPGGRALITHDSLHKRMASGTHRFGKTTLLVSRGFGMTHWPIRFCCPAEVVEIRLDLDCDKVTR